MRPVLVSALALVLVACSGGAGEELTTTTSAPTITSTTLATTTTRPPPECPRAPYELDFLPAGVGQGELESAAIDPDVWTSVAGSHTTFVPRSDDTVAIAIIRGTLPAVDWPGEKGEVSIDGTPAVVGPHRDGTWVAGWFEEPGERCDLYTMVFYPPWAPTDVEEVLAEMDRVGG
jgi:hypothetical protein